MWFVSHFTVDVTRLLLSSRFSLLVINLLTTRANYCTLINEPTVKRETIMTTKWPNSDMQDKPHKIKYWEIYGQSADTNIVTFVFCIVRQFQFHSASQQIQELNTPQISFYPAYNFHLQFTNKSVSSQCPAWSIERSVIEPNRTPVVRLSSTGVGNWTFKSNSPQNFANRTQSSVRKWETSTIEPNRTLQQSNINQFHLVSNKALRSNKLCTNWLQFQTRVRKDVTEGRKRDSALWPSMLDFFFF